MKFGRLDQLEPRTTITEPISITGLSFAAFRGLAQLGIMSADGGNSALLGLAQMAQQAKQGPTMSHPAARFHEPATSIAIGLAVKQAPGAAGGGGSVQAVAEATPPAGQGEPPSRWP